MLALRGGAELVALWAQLASVVELVTGVALSGVGTGIVVCAARARREARRQALLREGLKLALLSSLPVALVLAVAGPMLAAPLSGDRVDARAFLIAALAGSLAVVPGVINGWWQGQQKRGRMLALAAGSGTLAAAAAALAPRDWVLEAVAASQALPAALALVLLRPGGEPHRVRVAATLRRYVLPGVAIGILSPASMLVARSLIGHHLGWHEAGVLQALWRLSDWVAVFAAGVLSVHFLPRFALRSALPAELGCAFRFVVVPAAAALAGMGLFHESLLRLAYGEGFVASPLVVALLFGGALMRVVSWVPLFALYARRQTVAIALGEWLSLPLFAAGLLVLGRSDAGITAEGVAAAWLGSFACYAAFNAWVLRTRRAPSAPGPSSLPNPPRR